MVLKIYDANSNPKRVYGSKGRVIVPIGRSTKKGNKIIIPDVYGYVSGRHCLIDYDPDDLERDTARLINLGQNGTYIQHPGGNLIIVMEKEEIKKGSVIYFPHTLKNEGLVYQEIVYPLVIDFDLDGDGLEVTNDVISKEDRQKSFDRANASWAVERGKIFERSEERRKLKEQLRQQTLGEILALPETIKL